MKFLENVEKELGNRNLEHANLGFIYTSDDTFNEIFLCYFIDFQFS